MFGKMFGKYKTANTSPKKHILIYILTACFAVSGLSLLSTVSAQDLMEQAFQTARDYDTIVDLGNTKDSVGNEALRESTSIGVNENLGQGCFINGQFLNVDQTQCTERGGDRNIQAIGIESKPSLFVSITKFLLRMTVVLSITMVIYNSILYMLEVLNGKDWKSTEAMKNIMRVAGGLVLALMSVGIINLVISVPKSSLKTSDDLGGFEIGCQTGATIIAGNDLKKYVCENVFDGDRLENKTFRKCDILGDRRSIKNDEMETSCVVNMGGTVIK